MDLVEMGQIAKAGKAGLAALKFMQSTTGRVAGAGVAAGAGLAGVRYANRNNAKVRGQAVWLNTRTGDKNTVLPPDTAHLSSEGRTLLGRPKYFAAALADKSKHPGARLNGVVHARNFTLKSAAARDAHKKFKSGQTSMDFSVGKSLPSALRRNAWQTAADRAGHLSNTGEYVYNRGLAHVLGRSAATQGGVVNMDEIGVIGNGILRRIDSKNALRRESNRISRRPRGRRFQ